MVESADCFHGISFVMHLHYHILWLCQVFLFPSLLVFYINSDNPLRKTFGTFVGFFAICILNKRDIGVGLLIPLVVTDWTVTPNIYFHAPTLSYFVDKSRTFINYFEVKDYFLEWDIYVSLTTRAPDFLAVPVRGRQDQLKNSTIDLSY